MSFYVIVRNSDSVSYFPSNASHRFQVALNSPLTFNPGEWSVALCELYCSSVDRSEDNIHEIYVSTNICQTSLVGDSELRLLRRVTVNPKRNSIPVDSTFSQPFYMPVSVSECRTILVEITNVNGEPASFLNGRVTATLHFKRRPFIL